MFEIMSERHKNYTSYYILWYDKYKHRFSRTGHYKSFKAALDAAESLRGDNNEVQPDSRTDQEDHTGINERSESGAYPFERSRQDT